MQKRWPDITTSVSGITAEDWNAFRAKADRDKIKYKAALEQAISDLAVAARRGDAIAWQPAKIAPSRPIRIHDDIRKLINALNHEFGFQQNVIVATAIHRWLSS
jgi:S1-C subfamily serine protease